jgi:hypothetical protein
MEQYDIFKLTDKHSKSFLDSEFFYMPNLKKVLSPDGGVLVDGDEIRRALTQLVVDGHMVEISPDTGKYYLTAKGRAFIIRGGYAKQLEDETEIRKLADEKLKTDLINAERVKNTYWITFWIAIAAFAISLSLLVLKITE